MFCGCSVNGSVVYVLWCLTVFVNCLVKQFAICLGVICYVVVECYGPV